MAGSGRLSSRLVENPRHRGVTVSAGSHNCFPMDTMWARVTGEAQREQGRHAIRALCLVTPVHLATFVEIEMAEDNGGTESKVEEMHWGLLLRADIPPYQRRRGIDT